MAFKPLSWLAGQTDFHADAPGTGPGQAAIRKQMMAASGRGQSQAYGLAASARGGSSPLALREAQRQAAFANQAAAQQGAIASGQLEQQRLQNIMEQQRINAGIAQGNAGGILKLAGVVAGGAALASDERAKDITGVMPMPQRREEPKQEGGMLGGILSDERAKRTYSAPGTYAFNGPSGAAMEDERATFARHAKESGVELKESDYAAVGYGRTPSSNPFAPKAQPTAAATTASKIGAMGGLLGADQYAGVDPYLRPGTVPSDARAKDLEGENRTLRARLAAGATAATGLALGPVAMAGAAPAALDWARRGGGQQNHTPAAPTPRPQLQAQETPALAPTEAEALAIVRAREVAKRKAMERDVGAYTEQQQQVANERQQLAAEPGSGGRMAAVGRNISDERAKMYPSDEDAKMQFPAGVKPVHFTYKPEAQAAFGEDGGENVGLLAQDLEKSPEGATVVEEDPGTGMKMVDTGKLTMLATAKLAEMEARMKVLEAKRGKRS